MKMQQSPIIYLWTVPRSVSTAFEKMVDNRGDMTVFGEPFIDCYKTCLAARSTYTSADHMLESSGYIQVINQIKLTASKGERVFVKEMAYHVKPLISTDFLQQYKNTFLIRHPSYTLPSLYRMRPNFTWEETGFEQLYKLFCIVQEISSEPLIVIDGQDLRTNPEKLTVKYFESLGLPVVSEALSWNPGLRPAWENRQEWHRLAMESIRFLPPTEPDLDTLKVPQIASVYEQCVYYYDKLAVYKMCI